MLTCYKIHEMVEHQWDCIELNHTVDQLKEDLETVDKDSNLIHDKSFMMSIIDKRPDESLPFHAYLGE